MPSRPPNLKRPAKRKAWEKRKDIPDGRIRGRRGQELRQQRLAAEPRCRLCLIAGRVTQATIPDHIVPLAFGGQDVDDNVQCLCEPCHDQKSAFESQHGGGAANHPEWVRPSKSPLTILCGPPCSGKTTYVRTHAGSDDVVIDLDTIKTALRPSYVHWTQDIDNGLLDRAIRVRNHLLGMLSRSAAPRAWLIVAAPTDEERQWWRDKLGGEVILLHPGVAECKRRAVARGTPQAIEGINKWEARAGRPWKRTSRVLSE